MTTTSPESLDLLGRAAELRATGVPWADAATKLALDHDELRALVSDHARDYERLVRRARADVLRETLDGALTALRTLVKSPDQSVCSRAATTIVRYELARMRHGTKEAGARLERDTRRSSRREKMTDGAEKVREENVSESTKVPNQQEVTAAKNVAQSTAPGAPANAARVPSQPTPTPPKPTPPATPVAERSKTSVADAIRKKRLLDVFARGQTPPAPATKGVPPTLEVEGLISSWLAAQ